MSENSTKSKYVKTLMNNKNFIFGYPPPKEKLESLKHVKQSIFMNVEIYF